MIVQGYIAVSVDAVVQSIDHGWSHICRSVPEVFSSLCYSFSPLDVEEFLCLFA